MMASATITAVALGVLIVAGLGLVLLAAALLIEARNRSKRHAKRHTKKW